MRHVFTSEDDLVVEIIRRADDLRNLHVDAQAAYPILDAAVKRLADKRNDRGEFAPAVETLIVPADAPTPKPENTEDKPF